MEEEDDADYGEEEDPEGNPDEDGEDDEEGDGLGGHAKMVAFHAAIKAVLTRQLEKMGQEVEVSFSNFHQFSRKSVTLNAISGAQHRKAGQPWERGVRGERKGLARAAEEAGVGGGHRPLGRHQAEQAAEEAREQRGGERKVLIFKILNYFQPLSTL